MLEYKKELKADLASRIPYGVMVQAKGWDKPIDIRELDLHVSRDLKKGNRAAMKI